MSEVCTSSSAKTSPIRQCGGCKKRLPAAALVRYVVRDGQLFADLRRRHQGRGVHVCPRQSCVTALLKRRGLRRGLRGPGGWTEPVVVNALREAVSTELARLGSMAERSEGSSDALRLAWLSSAATEFSCTLRGAGDMNRRHRAQADEAQQHLSVHPFMMGSDE